MSSTLSRRSRSHVHQNRGRFPTRHLLQRISLPLFQSSSWHMVLESFLGRFLVSPISHSLLMFTNVSLPMTPLHNTNANVRRNILKLTQLFKESYPCVKHFLKPFCLKRRVQLKCCHTQCQTFQSQKSVVPERYRKPGLCCSRQLML